MWNVEENEKCRIIPSRCPNPNFAFYPFCEGCEIVNLGTDYCLYGDESGPCIIDENKCGYKDKENDTRFVKRSTSASIRQITFNISSFIIVLLTCMMFLNNS